MDAEKLLLQRVQIDMVSIKNIALVGGIAVIGYIIWRNLGSIQSFFSEANRTISGIGQIFFPSSRPATAEENKQAFGIIGIQDWYKTVSGNGEVIATTIAPNGLPQQIVRVQTAYGPIDTVVQILSDEQCKSGIV